MRMIKAWVLAYKHGGLNFLHQIEGIVSDLFNIVYSMNESAFFFCGFVWFIMEIPRYKSCYTWDACILHCTTSVSLVCACVFLLLQLLYCYFRSFLDYSTVFGFVSHPWPLNGSLWGWSGSLKGPLSLRMISYQDCDTHHTCRSNAIIKNEKQVSYRLFKRKKWSPRMPKVKHDIQAFSLSFKNCSECGRYWSYCSEHSGR